MQLYNTDSFHVLLLPCFCNTHAVTGLALEVITLAVALQKIAFPSGDLKHFAAASLSVWGFASSGVRSLEEISRGFVSA
jgi:hypothetical protein